MTAAEYMRAALEFQKKHRAVVNKLQNVLFREGIAKGGKAEPLADDAVEAVIVEHQRLVLGMFELGMDFMDDGTKQNGNLS